MDWWKIFVAAGIPSGLFGLLIWYFQKRYKHVVFLLYLYHVILCQVYMQI